MSVFDILTATLVLIGSGFFLAGTLGILRFPDVHSRLHAITKADNLGLGLIVLGLMLQAVNVATILKLLVIWVVALVASSTSCYLIAGYAERSAPALENDN